VDGVWRGTITRVDGSRAWVRVERLGRQHEYGPCDVAEGPWTAGRGTEIAGIAEAHAHGLGADLAAGDRVLVAFLEGRRDDLVVLARLP